MVGQLGGLFHLEKETIIQNGIVMGGCCGWRLSGSHQRSQILLIINSNSGRGLTGPAPFVKALRDRLILVLVEKTKLLQPNYSSYSYFLYIEDKLSYNITWNDFVTAKLSLY